MQFSLRKIRQREKVFRAVDGKAETPQVPGGAALLRLFDLKVPGFAAVSYPGVTAALWVPVLGSYSPGFVGLPPV
jgi:hypothetical protein